MEWKVFLNKNGIKPQNWTNTTQKEEKQITKWFLKSIIETKQSWKDWKSKSEFETASKL